MADVFRGYEARFVMALKKQTDYATALLQADLDGGNSYRPTAAILPNRQVIRAGEGARPMQGDEFSRAASERITGFDNPFSLGFNLDEKLLAHLAGLLLGEVGSIQEGITGHWTHTIKPSDPKTAGLDALVSSYYFDSGDTEAGRRKMIIPSVAVQRLTVTQPQRGYLQLAVDLIGSGKEDNATIIVIPALSTEQLYDERMWRIDLMNKGAGDADISARVREWSFFMEQELLADLGYRPNIAALTAAQFRSRMQFGRRSFGLSMVAETDRTSRDLLDRFEAGTETEVKITVDSGVVAGTGTDNLGFEARFPAVKLTGSPIEFDGEDGVYRVDVAPAQVFKDDAEAESPFTLTVESDVAAVI